MTEQARIPMWTELIESARQEKEKIGDTLIQRGIKFLSSHLNRYYYTEFKLAESKLLAGPAAKAACLIHDNYAETESMLWVVSVCQALEAEVGQKDADVLAAAWDVLDNENIREAWRGLLWPDTPSTTPAAPLMLEDATQPATTATKEPAATTPTAIVEETATPEPPAAVPEAIMAEGGTPEPPATTSKAIVEENATKELGQLSPYDALMTILAREEAAMDDGVTFEEAKKIAIQTPLIPKASVSTNAAPAIVNQKAAPPGPAASTPKAIVSTKAAPGPAASTPKATVSTVKKNPTIAKVSVKAEVAKKNLTKRKGVVEMVSIAEVEAVGAYSPLPPKKKAKKP